jgi:ubiquinone/menaquinone biosynthesis C-methylase UbiE
MGIYANCIVPHLVHLAMRNRRLLPRRERVIAAADGRVLEIGVGSGLNLPFYSSRVREVVGVDPAPRLLAMARRAAETSAVPVTLIEGSAEAIPLEDNSIDTAVTTWTLCTIPDAARALVDVRRVLRLGGQLLFIEHGLAPEDNVRRWQDRLTPVWRRISGGCHLNRPIRSLIEAAGYRIATIDTAYMEGPKPMAYLYEGRAVPG